MINLKEIREEAEKEINPYTTDPVEAIQIATVKEMIGDINILVCALYVGGELSKKGLHRITEYFKALKNGNRAKIIPPPLDKP